MLKTVNYFLEGSKKCNSIIFINYRLKEVIRKSLTADSCHALVRVMILSRLDYCNGLFYGAPMSLVKQLDGVMRAASRLVLQLPRMSSVTRKCGTTYTGWIYHRALISRSAFWLFVPFTVL